MIKQLKKREDHINNYKNMKKSKGNISILLTVINF